MKHWVQFSLLDTSGNQKWKGGTPAFIARAIEVSASVIKGASILSIFSPVKIETIKIVEASACTKKYLSIASEYEREILISMRGAILIKFISSPSQAVNQVLAETAITVPVIRVPKNIIW